MNIAFPRKLMTCNKTSAEESPSEAIHIPKDTKSILRKIKRFLPENGQVRITATDKGHNVTIHISKEGKSRGKTIVLSAKHCKTILLKYANSLLVDAKIQ